MRKRATAALFQSGSSGCLSGVAHDESTMAAKIKKIDGRAPISISLLWLNYNRAREPSGSSSSELVGDRGQAGRRPSLTLRLASAATPLETETDMFCNRTTFC